MSEFTYETRLDHPADTVFRWHERAGALERLTPPWEAVEVVEQAGIAEGDRTILMTKIGPLKKRWVAEHHRNGDPLVFRDVQVEGPFAEWDHTHRVRREGQDKSAMVDSIRYRLPLGSLGSLFGGGFVRGKLERLFEYRHGVLARDLARHAEADVAPMWVGITGSSGLVGSALAPFLTTGGHDVERLPRSNQDPKRLEGLDAVVHLAGENIAEGRWDAAKKDRIRRSRVEGTRQLCETLAGLETKPKVLVCASATGYYGDTSAPCTEGSPPGGDFLAEVCREWEEATEPAREAGIRVVNLRIGVVLTPVGGALAKMLPPFRAGVGGKLGSGEQWMSWISLDDLVAVIHRAIVDDSLAGPVNAVAPGPVTNAEFTRTLGRVLARPTIAPMPAAAARLVFGEMADAILLAGARVEPQALERAGFRFDFPELEGALRNLLGRPQARVSA